MQWVTLTVKCTATHVAQDVERACPCWTSVCISAAPILYRSIASNWLLPNWSDSTIPSKGLVMDFNVKWQISFVDNTRFRQPIRSSTCVSTVIKADAASYLLTCCVLVLPKCTHASSKCHWWNGTNKRVMWAVLQRSKCRPSASMPKWLRRQISAPYSVISCVLTNYMSLSPTLCCHRLQQSNLWWYVKL